MGLDARKPVFWVCEQQRHRPACTSEQTELRLISAFIIRFLKTITSRLAMSKIVIFLLVSVAGQAGLSLALSETPKTGFVATRPK